MDIEEKKRLFRITLGQNIKKYRELKGLSKTELAKLLSQKVGKDIAVSSCTKWEQGEYAPELPILGDLSEILDVRMDELVGYEKEKDSSEEIGIISNFRKLSLRQKEVVKTFIKSQLNNSYNSFVKSLKVFEQSACAGIGNYVDNDDYTIMEFDNPPISASFVVKVQGDSMTPLIEDNSFIYVRESDTADIGDIAVLTYDGNTYVKMITECDGKCYLHSLNSKYKDIIVYDISELKIHGIVL